MALASNSIKMAPQIAHVITTCERLVAMNPHDTNGQRYVDDLTLAFQLLSMLTSRHVC